MGATVITNKAAGVLVHNGETIYVLFEQTYEKNVYPHTPRWSAWRSGTIDQIIHLIYRSAAACEGGMLQAKSGWITPESYIRGWEKKLAAPLAIAEHKVLSFARRYSDDSVLEKMIEVCHCVGDVEAVEALRQGLKVHRRITSPTGIALLKANIPAYRLDLDTYDLGEEVADAGYRPKKASISPMSLPVLSTMLDSYGSTVVLKRTHQGSWLNLGATYRAVSWFIQDQLVRNELAYPGTSMGLLKAFRAAIDDAGLLNASAVFLKPIPDTCYKYRRTCYEELLGKLKAAPGEKVSLEAVKAALGDRWFSLFDLSEQSLGADSPALLEFEGEGGSVRCPKYVALKPEPGMCIEVNGSSYTLTHSLGRKGWEVTRCDDNLRMSISSRHLASVLRDMSDTAFNVAKKAAEQAAENV